MSVESVARSTSITTVSRPTYGHTEVSSVSLGHSSRAEPPCSLPVFPPAPLMGDAKGTQSPSLLPLSAAGGRPEKERRPPLLGKHTGVGGSRTCHQASAASVPCLLCTGLFPPRMLQCCSVSVAPVGKVFGCHLICPPRQPWSWGRAPVSILKMRAQAEGTGELAPDPP